MSNKDNSKYTDKMQVITESYCLCQGHGTLFLNTWRRLGSMLISRNLFYDDNNKQKDVLD